CTELVTDPKPPASWPVPPPAFCSALDTAPYFGSLLPVVIAFNCAIAACTSALALCATPFSRLSSDALAARSLLRPFTTGRPPVTPDSAWETPAAICLEPLCASAAPFLSCEAPAAAAARPVRSSFTPAPACPSPAISFFRSFLLFLAVAAAVLSPRGTP